MGESRLGGNSLWCCTRDEGRSLEIGMQVQVSNHLKLLWLRVMVVSVKEKARLNWSGMYSGDERK